MGFPLTKIKGVANNKLQFWNIIPIYGDNYESPLLKVMLC